MNLNTENHTQMEMSDDSKDGHADFECIEVAKTLDGQRSGRSNCFVCKDKTTPCSTRLNQKQAFTWISKGLKHLTVFLKNWIDFDFYV